MTPDQLKLVQQSFARVVPISGTAAELFYGRLFEVAPQLRAMFPEDMSGQHMKLMAMLATVVNGLSDLPTILPAASARAKRHVDYRVGASHYPVVGEVLLWTLKKGLGEAWTSDLSAAWTAAYCMPSSYMISEAYGQKAASRVASENR